MSLNEEVLGNYNPLDNTLYYITIANETKTVSTTCVGIGCVDNALKDSYKSIDELPSWVRDQIVRINMLKTTDMNNPFGLRWRASDMSGKEVYTTYAIYES
tara:strand:- start:429 stop:731 length:303 start_codon:yes stop_codon:yes gene_type:complete